MSESERARERESERERGRERERERENRQDRNNFWKICVVNFIGNGWLIKTETIDLLVRLSFLRGQSQHRKAILLADNVHLQRVL